MVVGLDCCRYGIGSKRASLVPLQGYQPGSGGIKQACRKDTEVDLLIHGGVWQLPAAARGCVPVARFPRGSAQVVSEPERVPDDVHDVGVVGEPIHQRASQAGGWTNPSGGIRFRGRSSPSVRLCPNTGDFPPQALGG
jgi:hypothetical protein